MSEPTLPPTEDQSELIAKLTRENEALRKENERLRGLKYATSSDIDREVQKLQSQRLDVLSDRVSMLMQVVESIKSPSANVRYRLPDATVQLLSKGTAQYPDNNPVAGPLGGAS